ncbi:MAG: hypothetical protein ACLR3R_19835 [Clostridium paraputrificum]
MCDVIKSLFNDADSFIDFISKEKYCPFTAIKKIYDLQCDIKCYLHTDPSNIYDVSRLKDKVNIMGEILEDKILLEIVSEILDSFERYFDN